MPENEDTGWDHEPTAGELGLCGAPSDVQEYKLIGVKIPPHIQEEIDKAITRIRGQEETATTDLDYFIVNSAYRAARAYNRAFDFAALQNAHAADDVPPPGHPLREAAEEYTHQPRPIRDNPQA